jgi:hypothetical protein
MRHFDSADFLRRFDEGEFDGRLQAELGKLSFEELQQIAELLEKSQAPPDSAHYA